MENLILKEISQGKRTIYSEVGNIIYSRDKKEKGVVKKISSRYCAACGGIETCYVVEWEDGKITKPCIAGVGVNLEDGTLYIM